MAKKKFELTKEQEKAIDHPHDTPGIVAAAAGSGKTTLLVDRVVRLLSDLDLNITADSLAIMTFTRNATKSMREKLTKKLTEKLNALANSTDENDRKTHEYLKRQVFLLRQAAISTIDAFCLRMIKENAEAFDLPLSFTLADDAKVATMQAQAMGAALETLYSDKFSDTERDTLFFSFSFEDDYNLEKALRSAAEKLSCFPDPEQWMKDAENAYTDINSLEANFLDLLDDFLAFNVNRAKIFAAKYSAEEIYESLFDFVEGKRKEKKPDAEKLDTMDTKVLPGIKDRIAADEKRVKALAEDYEKYLSDKTVENLAELMANLEANSEELPNVALNIGFGSPIKTRFGAIRDEIKSALKNLLDCKIDIESEKSGVGFAKNALRTFFKLLNIYRENYALEKRAAGCIDFADCERELYNKLSENGGDNDFRRQLSERFSCIIVDEFQDCNNIQAELFKLLGENRLFYVGDVKQSIYSFRGADPYVMAELCSNKERGFKELLLNTNFRSRQAIIDIVNKAFTGLMTTKYGGVDYNKDTQLYKGLDYPPLENSGLLDSEITFLLPSKQDEDTADDKKMTLARYVAGRIQDLINNEDFLVCDEERDEDDNFIQRRAKFSDFIVLVRSGKNIPCYRKALAELNIPSTAKSGSGFFEADEVKLVRNYLKIIDNPRLNEEFLKILMSPIYRFTAEEAAQIRMGILGITEIGELVEEEKAEDAEEAEEADATELSDEEKLEIIVKSTRNHPLISCVNDCMTQTARFNGKRINVTREIPKKLIKFTEDLKAFRYCMTASSLVDLVRKVYEDTELISIVAAFEDSAQRVGNIRQLQQMAANFESRSGGGLGDFLRFLDRAAENASKGVEEAAAPDSAENAVRIMTFHASKGLEAPVCIMSELQTKMVSNDYTGNLLLSREHFMAMALTDIQRRKKSKLLAYHALSKFIRDRRIGDELRLLYVAMTRAKEKLIMVSEISKKKYGEFTKNINGEKWFTDKELHDLIYEDGVPFNIVFNWLLQYAPTIDAKAMEFSFEDFACKVSVINPNAKAEVKEDTAEEKAADEEAAEGESLDTADIAENPELDEEDEKIPEEKTAALSALIHQKYAHPEDTVQQAKFTTTELAHKKDVKPMSLTKPSFASDKKVSGVEKGNAYHHCMQHFPLASINAEMSGDELLNAVRAALDEMVKAGKITADERKIVEAERIAAFFENSLGKRMLAAFEKNPENVKREQSFYAEVNGDEVRQEYSGKISIQGQIDMYFIEDGEIVVVDYKSDTIENLAKEKASYEFQVEIYTTILGKLTGMNVKEMYLYAFLANSELFLSLRR